MKKEPIDYDATYILWSSTQGKAFGKIWFDRKENRIKADPEDLIEDLEYSIGQYTPDDGARFFQAAVRSGNSYSFFIKEENA